MDLKEEIKKFFKGEVSDDPSTLKTYSRDASLFGVLPRLVVYPVDQSDLASLVKWVNENKKSDPSLSITIRSAGSCMSGGPLGESIVADVCKNLNKVKSVSRVALDTGEAVVEPGVYYRDFEPLTLEKGLILPCYTASKNLNALGGMFGNNSAGEKTLRYGKMENFILESKVILADGNEYLVRPLSKNELEVKMSQDDFEGSVYKNIFNMIQANKQTIEDARPRVSKNSAGYYLWNVWNGEIFDLNRLLVGSQGTLALMTEMKIRLVPVEPKSKLFVIFMPNLDNLAGLVNEILPTNPESIETYDDATMKLAFRFFPEMIKSMKVKHFFKLMLSFIPEALMMLRGGIPKLIVLVEYAGSSDEEVEAKMKNLQNKIKHFGFIMRETKSEEESEKYWTVRRESFNLLRKHIRGSRTAPFVDDVVVRHEDMPRFLPEMREILDSYNLVYTIAGHAGNGNFHIIPLMDMRIKDNVRIIREVGEKVYSLVAKYHGSITGEHNDGIVRTPYLSKMYSSEALDLFKKTKDIFDPQNIFNPGKKVPSLVGGRPSGTIEYLEDHIVIE